MRDPAAGIWNRWPGHPGWGDNDRWNWNDGYPHWWGWVLWSGVDRSQCLDWYSGELNSCNGSCANDNNACVQQCAAYGDPDCTAQCNDNYGYCTSTCQSDYDGEAATCPAF